MEQIACKECTSPNCHGCNMYRLERMLMSGKLDALMDENRAIKMDADVRPVVHGEWLRTPTFWAYCSVCGEEPPKETNITTNYCPNCGARMEEADD